MKIAVITFHAARNYGAVLQAYALQTYLQKAGNEPFFINYKFYWNPSFYNPRRWLSRTPRGMTIKINDNILRYVFMGFQNKHLIMSARKYSGFALQDNPPVADAYICGSDQIWNPNGMHANDESAVWLNFGDDNVRRIAYAPSFGVPDLDDAICKRWSRYARRFHSVSVREKDGVELMKKLGRNDAVWVPDPTLLLDASDYAPVESESNEPKHPSLFSYLLGTDNDELASHVQKTAQKRLGIGTYVSRPLSLSHNLFRSGFVGPDKWLTRLHQSVFVITNSFHGLVFSLIFHRPFIVLLRAQKEAAMNSRVTSLLDVVGLQNRAILECDGAEIERLCHERIEWGQVDARLKIFRETGRRFLRDTLV